MDFVTPIITPIVESLIVPIKKHLDFLVSSSKHAKEMDKRIKQLNNIAKDVENKKETAVVRNEVVPQHVGPWLEDVRKMNEEALSISTAGIGCFVVATRYRAGKRSWAVVKEIEDLERRESKIKWSNEEKALAKVDSTSTSTGPSTSAPDHDGDDRQIRFESRDSVFKAALKFLQPDNQTQKMIALCGMGGVGKTTMMEQLKKVVEDSKLFDWVVKVVLGEDTNPIALQRAIAEYAGKKLTETAKDARAERLGEIFKGMSQDGKKRILVIMDDLWKEFDLKDVGLSPLPNGFKLLFTSRFEYVCTQMGVKTDSVFKVGILNDEEAKTLFFKIVELDGDDPELHKIGEKIVKKCGGLPIAIKTIASSLRGDIKDAWQDVLSNLQHHDLQDLDDIRNTVFEMSFNNLKKEDEKAIFLLSGLFPDDFNIPIEDLIRYGLGLKLFDKVHTLADARRRTNTCVNKLMRANLLMESDHVECVKMHDLTREFVLTNFTDVKQASIVNHEKMWLTQDANVSYGRILLNCKGMSQFPAEFSYPNISLLMLTDGNKRLKFPEDFFERMRKLEVVSYERMHAPLLHVRFELSTKLRTLCLRSCSLTDDFSFLESLHNLEILSFADCKMRNLPSTIGKLKRLKLLDVTGCVDLSIDDGVFVNLVGLEELYMKVFENKGIRFTHTNYEELKDLLHRLLALELEFIEKKAPLKNVSFKQLERFRISIGCTLEYPKDYPFRNTLDLVTDCDELQECKISELFEKTEELRLEVNDMTGIKDLSIMNLSERSFFKLRKLVVSGCSSLIHLFTIPVASGLKKLELLAISNCPKLVSLCETADNEIELPQMVELILDGLPNFTSIYPGNNNASAIQSFLNTQVAIPKLEILEISMMENLKQIWPCQVSSTDDKNKVSKLREIRVRKCDGLENLFPRNPLPLLGNLQELEIEECGSIEVLFNIDLERVCEIEEESSSSRLRKIKVDGLGKLRELWRIEGVNNSNVLINSFKGVESIEIRSCERFTHIFTPTSTKFELEALTTYTSVSTGTHQEISELADGNISNVTYTSHLVQTCHNLQHLDLKNDPRVEVVFEMDTPSSRELASISNTQQLLLPHHLKSLELSSLREMSHVWKYNWNKFSIPQPLGFPFNHLIKIYLKECQKIKYLFSPLMTKFLSNLKEIEIDNCGGMKEVISSRDDEMCATSTSSHISTNTTFFPHLDGLSLRNMPCLKRIDDEIQAGGHEELIAASNWSLCQYPKFITVIGCNALSSVIPWYAVGQMKKLEELYIEHCSSIREVFESVEASASGGTRILLTTSSPVLALKNNITTTHVPQLSNLKEMHIYRCDLVQHVFTFSTLESLKQLKSLYVIDCKATQVIVKEEEEIINGKEASSSSSKGGVVVFPRLEWLKLRGLPKLEGFFLGNKNNIHFRWPLLDYVWIINCPQMSVFTSGHSETPKLKYIYTGLGKHTLEECGLNFDFHGSEMTNTNQHYHDQTTLFSSSDPTLSKGMPCSFHNLIEIRIFFNNDVETIIPSNALLQLQKLEKIKLHACWKVKEVFEVGSLEGTNSESQTQTVVKIPNLKEVNIIGSSSLNYIWKSNQWMVLEFPNLTTVSIERCGRLKHVFTCSMAGSLVQLQHLRIRYCKTIEVIIKDDEKEDDDDDDAKVNDEILLLPHLKSIMLEKLPSLKGFCLGKKAFSLPLLDSLEIKNPAITVFTKGRLATPELKVIDTSFGMFCVRNNLNSVIRTKQEEGMFCTNGAVWNLSLSPWLFDEENRD